MNRLFLLILCSVLSSCDPYSEASLCNESGTGIEVTIRIDHEFVTKNYEGEQSVRFLKGFAKARNLIELAIDTVSLQGVYKLEMEKCSILYEGISSTPRFMFNYLKISSNGKTFVYDTRDKIEKAFLSSNNGKYKLVIKE